HACISGSDVVAIYDSGDRSREYRVGIAVEPRSVIRGHRQDGGGDGQRTVVDGHAVIAQDSSAVVGNRGNNRIRSRVAVDGCRRAVSRRDVVVILDADDGAGKDRVGLTK